MNLIYGDKMNITDFDKGTKRKCGSCSTLFYDFNKLPLICPNCGADVNLLTNISKRGRPPKINKNDTAASKTKDEINIDDIESSEDEIIHDDENLDQESLVDDDLDEKENVESILEIKREEDD